MNEIILGCQAFGVLSEQRVAKNSLRGARGAQWTEGVRGNTRAVTKMASKGENLAFRLIEDSLRSAE